MARFQFRRTYRWVDKDPLCDALAAIIRDEHLKPTEVHNISGVGAGTVDKWLNGETRKPQNDTSTTVSAALGYVRADHLEKDGTVTVAYKKVRRLDWREEIEKQADWMLQHGTAKQKKQLKKRMAKAAKAKGNGHG